MDLEELLVRATSIDLTVDEYYLPDAGAPDDYQGPRLVAFARRLAMLTPVGQVACEWARPAAETILEAVLQADDERGLYVQKGRGGVVRPPDGHSGKTHRRPTDCPFRASLLPSPSDGLHPRPVRSCALLHA